jgi:hypothetical protein
MSEAFADSVFQAVKSYISQATAGLVNRLDQLEKRIDALPAPRDGRDGADGKDGKDGIDGKDGAPGRSGLSGRDGQDGIDGQDGKDGEPGQDGADLDILPSINLEKSYPRGTWANHAHGLWLARSQTDGMAGWDCVVRGIAEFEVHCDGERTFTIKTIMSDGLVSDKTVKLPIMIDRGVYVDGKSYERGDTVSWAGSAWIAQVPTAGKPGTGEDWRLAVKRGRDGKDGALPADKPVPAVVRLR